MYIDPSVGALLGQLLVSTGVALYLVLRRGYSKLHQFLTSDPSRGISGALIALSFANLTLLRVWTDLFGFSESDAFEMKASPPWTHFAGALVDLLVIALLIWPIVRQISRPDVIGTVCSAALLALSAVPLNAMRDVVGARYFPMLRFGLVRAYGPLAVKVLCVLALVFAVAVIMRLGRQTCRVFCFLLLLTSPFALITTGQALWNFFSPPAAFAVSDAARAHRGHGRTSGSRVVWLLFDEMDQRITFEDRPRVLEMPEFDRLRSTAIYANAVHEAGENTDTAVTSLLTGRTVLRTRELGPARLGLSFEGSPVESEFAETVHLFGRAGALGFSSAVAGWGMPYCRLFGRDLDHCWWCESVRPDNSIRAGLTGATIDGLRSLLETKNFSPFGQSICLRQHIEDVANLTREAIKLAINDDIDLAFLHLHGAHPPHVYDRQKRDFSLVNSPITGYPDSLALCDLTLGRLRLAMEQRGLWDRTAVLVASDHRSRSSQVFDGKTDHRSIFILKMPGQDRGVVFGRPMNAAVTGDLILEILRGTVKSAEDANAWLVERTLPDK